VLFRFVEPAPGPLARPFASLRPIALAQQRRMRTMLLRLVGQIAE
jgi:hypothetical protein